MKTSSGKTGTYSRKSKTKKKVDSRKIITNKKHWSLSRKQVRLFVVASIVAVTVLGFSGYASYKKIVSDATSGTSFTFGTAGDFGFGSAPISNFKAVGQAKLNFFLSTGDLINGNGSEASWCKMARDNINIGAGYAAGNAYGQNFPFEFVVGNHDVSNNNPANFISCLPDKMSSVGTYGKQYYFDYPTNAPIARFIMASPGIYGNYKQGGAEYNFVKAAIDGAQAKSNIKWIIVVNHKTHISAFADRDNGIGDYFNLLVSEKVDLILEGHDHSYQRSKQLSLATGCATVPRAYDADCISDKTFDGQYQKGNGPFMVLTGTGGKSFKSLTQFDYFEKTSKPYGFTKIDVSETSLKGTFVRTGGAAFSDTFTITGGSSAAPAPVVTPAPTPAPTPTPTPTPAPVTTPTPVTTTPKPTTPSPSTSVADTTKPNVTLVSPTSGSAISGQYEVVATASDNVGVAKVEFLINGNAAGEDTSSPYSYTWDTSDTATGVYKVQVKAYDAKGNVATSAVATVSINNTGDTANSANGSTNASLTSVKLANQDQTTSSTVSLSGSCSENITAEQADIPDSLKNSDVITGIGFTAGCSEKSGSAQVSIDLGRSVDDISKLKVYKDQKDGSVKDITADATIENRTYSGATTAYVTYTITDGTSGDMDGQPDGIVIDPVYVVIAKPNSFMTLFGTVLTVVLSIAFVAAIVLVIVRVLKNRQTY